MSTFTLKSLQDAICGQAAAFRSRTAHQPAGGEGTPAFPPTYEGGTYATVGYRDEKIGYRDDSERGKRLADQVVLDSVQSQANRMEEVLLDAWRDGRIKLPVVTVDFSGNDLEKDLRVTSLEAPHRIADAILRDSLLDGTPFRKSELGRRLDLVDLRNATALFELCPTALLFGMWDSTGPKGGLGAKFQRAIVSEIVGHNVQIGVKTASRIDPTEIRLGAGPIYQAADTQGIGWTLDESLAKQSKEKPLLLGKDGKPSEANHGNVTPSFDKGGVTMERAVQTTVVSLPALRRLRFPLNGDDRSKPDVDRAAQAVLAALGLCAAALTRESGCDLRSRCQLFPAEKLMWELLDRPGSDPMEFELTGDAGVELFNEAVAAARTAGLPWREDELVLTPAPELVELVRKSQQLSAATADGEG